MKMKKTLCLILALMMTVCCLTSCFGEEENEFVRGSVSENGWQSEWIGLKFELADNMTMSSAEDIENMMEIGADAYFTDSLGEKAVDYSKVAAVYEMMAIDELGNNVIVMAEKLPNPLISMDQYIEAFRNTLGESLIEDVQLSEKEDYTLAGQEYTKVELSYKLSGIEISQTCLFRKQSDRMIGIMFTEIRDGAFEKMAAMFSASE